MVQGGRRAAELRLRAARPPRPRRPRTAGSTSSAARRSPARASSTASATSRCSRSRSTAGRSRAIVQKGHVPMLPPVLVREEAMYGTGFFPSDKGDFYEVPEDGLYLAGTSEVPLAAFHVRRGARRAAAPLRRVLDVLPPRGGRGRQGHARDVPRAPVRQGRDVRLLRAGEPRATSTSACSTSRRSSCRSSTLPYRVLNIAAGDLGASAAKKYDIEAWFPGQSRYREITSTSNTTDFQARRLDDPLPPRRQARARAHAERHGGDGARDDRDPRELPGRGRLDRGAGAARRSSAPRRASAPNERAPQ